MVNRGFWFRCLGAGLLILLRVAAASVTALRSGQVVQVVQPELLRRVERPTPGRGTAYGARPGLSAVLKKPRPDTKTKKGAAKPPSPFAS